MRSAITPDPMLSARRPEVMRLAILHFYPTTRNVTPSKHAQSRQASATTWKCYNMLSVSCCDTSRALVGSHAALHATTCCSAWYAKTR